MFRRNDVLDLSLGGCSRLARCTCTFWELEYQRNQREAKILREILEILLGWLRTRCRLRRQGGGRFVSFSASIAWISAKTLQIVGVNAETVTNVSSTDFPGHYPGEDHTWSLEKFSDVCLAYIFLDFHWLTLNHHSEFLRPIPQEPAPRCSIFPYRRRCQHSQRVSAHSNR